jgi:hypothetical protein
MILITKSHQKQKKQKRSGPGRAWAWPGPAWARLGPSLDPKIYPKNIENGPI